jgi:hypothetical protein
MPARSIRKRVQSSDISKIISYTYGPTGICFPFGATGGPTLSIPINLKKYAREHNSYQYIYRWSTGTPALLPVEWNPRATGGVHGNPASIGLRVVQGRSLELSSPGKAQKIDLMEMKYLAKCSMSLFTTLKPQSRST